MVTTAKVWSSLRWLGGARLLGQLLNWVATLIVIRLLTPDDYGLMALGIWLLGFFRLVSELGLGASIIQQKDLSQTTIRRIHGLIVLVDTVLFIGLFWLAPIVGNFFEEPRLAAVVQALAITFLLTAFTVVPQSLISRKMDFRARSIVELSAMFSNSGTTLVLAVLGAGVWALVGGHLMGTAIRMIGMNIAIGHWTWPQFSFQGLRYALRFGSWITASRVLWYIYSQVDIVIIGKVLGKELLGFYSVAIHLASLPMVKIAGILNDVGFSAFSRIHETGEAIGQRFVKALALLSFFAFPVFLGISAIAPELVLVLLGEKWRLAIFPLQIITLVMPLRMASNIMTPALAALGRPDISVTNTIIACVIMPPAFLAGLPWGLPGVALAWLIAYPILFTIMTMRALSVLHLDISQYLGAMKGPAVAAAAMYAIISVIRELLTEVALPAALVLPVLLMIGILSYGLMMLSFQKQSCREMLSFIRS